MARPVFRFAPSPNGMLHLGHAFSALLNFEMARRNGGRFLLRIEDIDLMRSKPEFEAAILRDLAWLGIEWEEPVRRQSEQFAAYGEALRRLREMGLLYPAVMSRGEIASATRSPDWPRDPDGAPLYPGLDRDLSETEKARRMGSGEAFALRLRNGDACARIGPLAMESFDISRPDEGTSTIVDPAAWGDVVLARKEIPTSYHLSVILDDASQGVTHVLRGKDLLAATSVHRLLQKILNLPEPIYHHHRLILGPDGHKLAKSSGGRSLAALREEGASVADIRRLVEIDAAFA